MKKLALFLIAILALTPLGSFAQVSRTVVRVGGWSPGRGGQSAVLENPAFRQRLVDTFMAYHLATEFVEFDTLPPDLKDRVDLLVIGTVFDGNGAVNSSVGALSGTERQSLIDAHNAGVGVLIASDGDVFVNNNSFLDPLGFGAIGEYLAQFQYNFLNPYYDPLTFGPFGATVSFTAGYSGWFSKIPPIASQIATLPNGGLGIVYVPVAGGAGSVVAISDYDGIATYYPENETFQRNAFAALAPATRDEQPPTTALSVKAGASACQVTLTPYDASSGVLVTSYKVDGNPWLTYKGPFTVDKSKDHTLQFNSVDLARNSENSTAAVIAKGAATATMSLSAGTGTVGKRVTLSSTLRAGSSALAGKTVRFLWDGGLIGTAVSNAAGKASLIVNLPGPAGNHWLVALYDGDGSALPVAAAALMELSPSVTASTLASATGKAGSVVNLTARLTRKSDNTGVAGERVEITIGSTLVGRFFTGADGRLTVPFTIPPGTTKGTYPLTLTYFGSNAYAGSSKAATIKVK